MKMKKLNNSIFLLIIFQLLCWNNSDAQEVVIGNQTWATENLDVETFRNGDTIPEAKTDKDWMKACKEGKPAWCYNDNDSINGKKYGKLYNGYVISDPRGLAPEGWHIPSNEEWQILEKFLRKDVANKLKSTSGWAENGNGTNSSGFNALPSGQRQGKTNTQPSQDADFENSKVLAYWWSSTTKNSNGHWYQFIYTRFSYFSASTADNGIGLSVRCIKD
ncbi:MAG: hypothetical protein RLZ33_944 [Bacteroidota bacterium]|jgi:uncharacterized protein (TIGR02145 family)